MQIDLKTGISILSMVVAAVSAGYAFMTTTNAGIQDLKSRITEIEAKIPDNFTPGLSKAQVQTLVDSASRGLSEPQVSNLIKAALQVQSETVHSILSDAVVAFARECPDEEGWSLFKPATARFIVGAGNEFDGKHEAWMKQRPEGGLDPVPLTARKFNSSGGEETVTLSLDQMPKHSHRLGVDPGSDYQGVDLATSRGKFGGVQTEETGGRQAHNNMPPYIALYFCKKN